MKKMAVVVVAALFGFLAFAGAPKAANKASAPKANVIKVVVTDKGFEPSQINVKQGEPVELEVTRKVEGTCATAIVIKDQGVKEELPLDKPVKVKVKTDKKGEIGFSCPMGMIRGTITVQ